jgi:hypothetical protein
MKIKKPITTALFLIISFISIGQEKSWHWSIEYAHGIGTPIFSNSNIELQENMESTIRSGFSQNVFIGGGCTFNEKWSINVGVGYKSLTYNNDSLGIEAVTMISKKFSGLEIPLLIQHPYSKKGWFIGIGGMYFKGIQDKTSYQLLNNNQRQHSKESSDLKGIGYQMQLGKQFKPDDHHVLSVRCIGQYYPNLHATSSNTFGFWDVSLGLGITF